MMTSRNIILFVFVVFSAAAVNAAAQIGFWDVENEVTKTLLKKDIRQAIREAENSSAGDLKSLLRRLTLYRRAANFEKVALTVRQILDRPDFNETRYQTRDFLEAAMGSEYFRDTKTLQLYVQKVGPGDNIYGKFIKVCTENRAACDVAGFDQWLAQKVAEAEKSSDKSPSEKYEWLFRQIDWRKRFGLDEREISNRFIEDVRRDPADLEAALRYLKLFRTSNDALWLAENFASPQAYSYYELGETIGHLPGSFPAPNMDEARQLWRIAIRLLLKSLEMPVNEKDIQLMYAHKFRYASVAPAIKNYEKQIRFWTKRSLPKTTKISASRRARSRSSRN